MSSVGSLLESAVHCRFGERHNASSNAVSSNLLFPVLYWLLSLAVSGCYSAAHVVKKSEFPRPISSGRCFFAAFISDISQRQESPASQLTSKRTCTFLEGPMRSSFSILKSLGLVLNLLVSPLSSSCVWAQTAGPSP